MSTPEAVNTFASIKSIEDNFQVANYKKMEIAIERGLGSWVWSSNGEKYLDLYGGHAVCATGHSHPHVVAAIKEQADRILFYSNLVYSEIRGRAAEKLVSIAPRSLTEVFFCNSGTEANENAMRIARLATGRRKIISFSGGFHGRSADSISATFLGQYRKLGEPNVPHHAMAMFGDIQSATNAIDNETAGVILEPIQSMSGIREANPEFFQALRQLCDKSGALLIFDEVQTGIGRTGTWFFSGSELSGFVEPDIITLAKSLGSGIPVGACIVSDKVAKGIKINDLGTTFGGGMIAMAAVLATLEAIEADEMMLNAKWIEGQLRKGIPSINGAIGLRGKGCLLGIEFEDSCNSVHKILLENRIITGTSYDPNVLRLMPPLCLTADDLEKFMIVAANL